ncbi:MAG: Tetratricopeptide 2 repeat-containing protein [Firmicutes bacterium]|nr:Tetratricopeptide 2 repeat-containing protein [Bacillota bacterium]
MEYILISITTISIFTYIVYILANKLFSVQMHIKYLLLCACCALIISLILPRFFISSAGLTGTLGIVTIFALISSYFIAYYYDDTMQKAALKKDVSTTLVEIPFLEILQTDNKVDIQPTTDLKTLSETNDLKIIVKKAESTAVITELTTKEYFYPMIYQEKDKSFKFLETTANDQMSNSENVLENIAEEQISTVDSTLKQYYYPMVTTLAEIPFSETLQTDNKVDIQPTVALETLSEIIVKETESIEVITELTTKEYFYPMLYQEEDKSFKFLETTANDQMSNSENVLENKIEEQISTVDSTLKQYYYPMICEEYNLKKLLLNTVKVNEEVEVADNHMNLTTQTDIINTSTNSEISQEHLSVPDFNELSDSFPSSNDLDILMDFAFLQKEQRNSLQALKTFRHALNLYPNSEVAPFLVMEIATILKNLGSYNEAIKVFTEGRLLPGVINNSMLEQEFINNIAYLRIIKNTLVKNSLEFMPFNLIPDNAFKEIDTEFCEWRNQS